jgi:hydrogenase nickel incorporation protein HypA/HybF
MHEYSIVGALLQQVEAEARKHADVHVQRVCIRVGELAGVEQELLDTAWRLFREGTCCEDAELAVRAEKARWSCPRCGVDTPPGQVLRCTRCQEPARLAAGDELLLERIEMEVNDV